MPFRESIEKNNLTSRGTAEQPLGLLALSAGDELALRAEAPPYTVPSPEQTAGVYDDVVRERNLNIPKDMNLGLVLARIPPERQSLFRAMHGMFPFDHRYTHAELATLRGVTEPGVYSMAVRTYKVLKNGVENYQKDNPRTQVSLETLARAILENRPGLQPHELDLLQQINGLPPYLIPLGPSEIAKESHVSRSAITLRERTAAQKLFGYIPAIAHPLRGALSKSTKDEGTPPPARSKMNRPKKPLPSSVVDAEHRRKLLRARDAGWYAGMLHSLHAEDSRDHWAETIRRELGRAAVIREVTRKRLQSHPAPLHRILGGAAFAEEKSVDARLLLDARRAFNPEYDTSEGQERIVQNLITHAQEHSPDLLDLETIMEEGMQAQQQLLEDNIALVFFTANRLDGSEKRGRAFSMSDLSAGYKGLREAVQRFDDSLGFAFSTYAAKMIAGRILKARTQDRAAKRGVGVSTLIRLDKIDRAEKELLQELQRAPTTEEIAEKAGLPNAAAVEKLQTVENRTDMIPLDKENANDHALSDAVGAVDPDIERIELADTFKDVFHESKLSDIEQRILLGLFGIASAEKTKQELAQELGKDTKEVQRLFRQAKNKIAKSAGARKLLRGYVEQVN
jgi:RNA polymerase sigma factor (sigma-70 family)